MSVNDVVEFMKANELASLRGVILRLRAKGVSNETFKQAFTKYIGG